jgi:hypothetical protein
MTELEELRSLLAQPLPGGRGFQATREKRIQHLHEVVINTLLQLVTDTYSHRELAEMYLEEHFGDEFGRPRLVLSQEFQELWADFHPDDDEAENTGE